MKTVQTYLTPIIIVFVVVGGIFAGRAVSHAQQVQLTNPYHTINDSFYENFGIGWGVDRRGPNGNGWFFNWGPASMTPPPFGGHDPAADARFGANINGFNFNFIAGQGSNRSHVMEAPTIVIPNGGSGGIFSGSQRPFVTGVIPVVGNPAPNLPAAVVGPGPSTSPVRQAMARLQQQQVAAQQNRPRAAPQAVNRAAKPAQRLPAGKGDDAPLRLGGHRGAPPVASGAIGGSATDSTANHGDISVAEIKRKQAAKAEQVAEEIRVRIEKARGHEQAGNTGVAKIYYQQAASRADGELKKRLQKKIRQLDP